MGRPGGLWRHRDFLSLWGAETISQFGSQVTFLALPLVAILALHETTFKVALLTTIEFLPFLLFALPAGVWVDRLRRRPILILGDIGRAVALASVPLAHWLGMLTIWQLYVVGFVTGVCISLIQAITPDRMLGRANASRRFIVWGVIPLGALVGGSLGSSLGLRPTIVVGALGGLLAVVPLVLSPVRSLVRVPDSDQPEAIVSASNAAA